MGDLVGVQIYSQAGMTGIVNSRMAHLDKASKFTGIFSERFARVVSGLEACLDEPDARSIHDLRTAIRRLESAYRVFPPRDMSASLQQTMRLLRDFFRQSSAIRDCDVICDMLLEQGLDRNDALILELDQRRVAALKLARRLAIRAKQEGETSPRVPAMESSRHYQRRIRKLTRHFLDRMPAVLAHEASVADIHSMRKVAKRLFYTLEMDREAAGKPVLAAMQRFHKTAGALHDSDVLLAFLRDNLDRGGQVQSLLENEERRRQARYARVYDLLSAEDWETFLKSDRS